VELGRIPLFSVVVESEDVHMEHNNPNMDKLDVHGVVEVSREHFHDIEMMMVPS